MPASHVTTDVASKVTDFSVVLRDSKVVLACVISHRVEPGLKRAVRAIDKRKQVVLRRGAGEQRTQTCYDSDLFGSMLSTHSGRKDASSE